jgi:tryptophan synthase alpha chain
VSRIADRFAALGREGRKALIPFVTAGDPHPRLTVPLMRALAAAGADIIELGVPFSDPMADGPVIQRAGERALAHHVGLRRVLELVAEFRRADRSTPVMLMGYLNPIEAMGCAEFAQAARRAGVDGVVTVDLPPEEADELAAALEREAIDPVFLVAPTTTPGRMRRIGACARGFIYYVSLKGVTGASNLELATVKDAVARLRQVSTLPIGVGFGIKDARSAMQVASVADAVIVGSALVRLVEEKAGEGDEVLIGAVGDYVRGLRQAIDGGVRAQG